MQRAIFSIVIGFVLAVPVIGLAQDVPAGSTPPASQAAQQRPTIRVLLIGNSLIYTFDMPAHLQNLAKSDSQGPLIEAVGATRGGWTLERHIKEGNVVNTINGSKWDYVVLQENSIMPIKDKSVMFAAGHTLDQAIDKCGAKTVLMMTWSQRESPQSQKPITQAYIDLGKELNAQVSPIGQAWAIARNDPSVTLYKDDGKHPALAGSYLSACVMYRTLTGRSPVGLAAPEGISPEQAAVLQKAAAEVAIPPLAEPVKANAESGK